MATIVLEDETVIKLKSLNKNISQMGEIVFNTSMTGYQEILTDPSYAGQIVIMTYPEIGNYGINDFDFESEKPNLRGFIVKNYSKNESHYLASSNLKDYLNKYDIPFLYDLDTRSLVKKIREKGTMACFITSDDLDENEINNKISDLKNYKTSPDIILEVTPKENYTYSNEGLIDLAFIDYGAKKGILESLKNFGCKIKVYRADTKAEEILNNNHDVLFLSNGPGNPGNYTFQTEQIKKMLGQIPIFGICLGYQLLAQSLGAKTYKLKYGHRGANHPVINLENNKVMITSQNHGYAVDTKTLTNIIRPTYKNLNDDTLEGFEVSSLNVYAVQFHPEANPGPLDAKIIFDEWINIMKRNKRINEVNNER